MDQKDREILDILKKDGRASYTDIAGDIDVSEGTVRNRINEMLEKDIIERFTVDTSSSEEKAVVLTELSTGVDIEKTLSNMPEDLEIYEVTGDKDLVIILEREDTEKINSSLDSIRSVEGVEDTITYTVLKTSKT